jgi:hypothetical protein
MNSKQKSQPKDTKARAKSKPAKKKKDPKREDNEAIDVVGDLPQVKVAAEMSQLDRDTLDKELFEKIVEL